PLMTSALMGPATSGGIYPNNRAPGRPAASDGVQLNAGVGPHISTPPSHSGGQLNAAPIDSDDTRFQSAEITGYGTQRSHLRRYAVSQRVSRVPLRPGR